VAWYRQAEATIVPRSGAVCDSAEERLLPAFAASDLVPGMGADEVDAAVFGQFPTWRDEAAHR